ncbi:MAG TPA: L-glutamate gamma-semialdehyde dehydrogenase [Longimicrobiales bacterium]
MLPEFRNEPLTDFSNPANVKKMEEALARVRDQLGQAYPLIIGDKLVSANATFESINPANPSQVVGVFQQGTVDDAQRALQAAEAAFPEWSARSAESRAYALLRTAAAIRQHKFDFCAWMTYEVSKSWVEADADVAELIDFAEYYARLALELQATAQPVYPYPGEDNSLRYIPLGPGVVIPPWNFPSAITGGMVMAAIVSGNTVVLKPASTAPAIAYQIVRALLDEGGIPHGVVNYLTGPGGSVGDALVDSPRTRFVALTGSKEVGMRIFERAAKVQPGQHFLKRSILEMGGKDGLVVDETADLDAAADAIVASAFGFQGQKCSACSRAIVVDEVHDEVLARVVERVRRLSVGDPVEPSTFMGAVIDEKAFIKIQAYIKTAVEEGGRIAVGGETLPGGYFIQPTVIADVKPDATIACEEIFGPVLAFMRAKDFDEAVRIFNGTEFGLTGGLMSRRRDRLERARNEFHVGNLYLNRKITGALVGVQPFGGFNMSGTDSKAGGPDYLLLFTQAKSICERFTVSTPARVSPL